MKRALTVQNIINKNYKTIDWDGEWHDAFGIPEASGVWFIWGGSGNGKTRFVMQLCKELCKTGKVMYVSLEEGSGLTFRNAISESGMAEVGSRLTIVERDTDVDFIDSIVARLKRQRSATAVIIDSFQYTGLSFKQYLDFKQALSNKLIIFTSQADGKQPSGRTAKAVMYDASLKIWVEGYRAFSKGRYIGPNGGLYTIWKEGADRYWGEF